MIGSLVSLFTGLFIGMWTVEAGLAGLALTYALQFNHCMLWIVRDYGSLEISMNSVERVQEYFSLEQEAEQIVETNRPTASWPQQGTISVQDLEVRYIVDQEPVIKGISFQVKAGERVGIVGRTGSGKSTLALTLFRYVEPFSGKVYIDGVDTSSIGLHDLRSKLTIIPQDAVLFAGTIRNNLDPFDEHTDDQMWAALKRSHITENGSSAVISSLDMPVAANGENFSQGQRQLLALARALIRNSKIIVMDEATASVDFDTDSKVQETIRTEFQGATLLCIAHRLRTVIDYDKVLVMDQGVVAEYDTPLKLLQKPEGLFKSMCEQTGEYEALLNQVKP
jgi:ABC-type multidrug transport system fused ATPase/permease subunit